MFEELLNWKCGGYRYGGDSQAGGPRSSSFFFYGNTSFLCGNTSFLETTRFFMVQAIRSSFHNMETCDPDDHPVLRRLACMIRRVRNRNAILPLIGWQLGVLPRRALLLVGLIFRIWSNVLSHRVASREPPDTK